MKNNFLTDFTKEKHRVVPGAWQWKPKKEMPVFISVVGGGFGLYGDGVNSFELMIGDKVHGHCSEQEVNEKINKVLVLITND